MLSRLVLVVVALVATAAAVVPNKKFTFLHITDVHGWIYGHRHIPELNADFGDFSSMIGHLHAKASSEGREFFLVDSGDIIEGTGLSDATDLHGEHIFPVIATMADQYHLLTTGNHDIGHDNSASYIKDIFAGNMTKAKYLTDNVVSSDDKTPLGGRYTITNTPKGTKILNLGFIFNFMQHSPNTDVPDVDVALQQPWFAEAVMAAGNDLDLIVLSAHIDPKKHPELDQIHAALRTHFPTVPIMMFVGHRHELYTKWYDGNAFAIESGKYFQALGLVDFEVDTTGQLQNLVHTFEKTTLDNLISLSGVPAASFSTPRSTAIKAYIHKYFHELDLDAVLGCTDITYDIRAAVNATDSFYNLWMTKIVPNQILKTYQPGGSVSGLQEIFLANSGTFRDNLYQGKIIRDDIFTVIPFSDSYYYFDKVPVDSVSTIYSILEGTPMSSNPTPSEATAAYWISDPEHNAATATSTPSGNVVAPRCEGGSTNLWADLGVEEGVMNTKVTDSVVSSKYVELPKWLHFPSEVPASTETVTMVVSEYDSLTLVKVLSQVAPTQQWAAVPYIAKNSTGVLVDYIEGSMSC